MPSKRLVVIMTILIIGVVLITVAPILIRRYKESRQHQPSAVLELTTLIGDPTTRDSDRDGIYDWQEIAVGLNPTTAETSLGVSDKTSFETITKNLSPETQELFKTSSDSTIISYTIYKNALALSSSGAIDDKALSEAAQQEFKNYILSLAPSEKYSPDTLVRIPSTPENDTDYLTKTKSIPLIDLFSSQAQKIILEYINQGSNKELVVQKISDIRTTLSIFEKIPIPESIFEAQRETFNALYAISILLETFNPTDADELYVIGYDALLRSYQMTIIKNTFAILNYYKDPRAAILRESLQKIRNLQ